MNRRGPFSSHGSQKVLCECCARSSAIFVDGKTPQCMQSIVRGIFQSLSSQRLRQGLRYNSSNAAMPDVEMAKTVAIASTSELHSLYRSDTYLGSDDTALSSPSAEYTEVETLGQSLMMEALGLFLGNETIHEGWLRAQSPKWLTVPSLVLEGPPSRSHPAFIIIIFL